MMQLEERIEAPGFNPRCQVFAPTLPSATLDTMQCWGDPRPGGDSIPLIPLGNGLTIDLDKSTYNEDTRDGTVIIKEQIGPIRNTYIHHRKGEGRETSTIKWENSVLEDSYVQELINQTLNRYGVNNK